MITVNSNIYFEKQRTGKLTKYIVVMGSCMQKVQNGHNQTLKKTGDGNNKEGTKLGSIGRYKLYLLEVMWPCIEEREFTVIVMHQC